MLFYITGKIKGSGAVFLFDHLKPLPSILTNIHLTTQKLTTHFFYKPIKSPFFHPPKACPERSRMGRTPQFFILHFTFYILHFTFFSPLCQQKPPKMRSYNLIPHRRTHPIPTPAFFDLTCLKALPKNKGLIPTTTQFPNCLVYYFWVKNG